MKNLTKAVGGSGLLISGTLFWLVIFAGLDFDRVERYGLIHELILRSYYPLFVFLFGAVLIFFGVVLIFSGVNSAERKRNDFDYDSEDDIEY